MVTWLCHMTLEAITWRRISFSIEIPSIIYKRADILYHRPDLKMFILGQISSKITVFLNFVIFSGIFRRFASKMTYLITEVRVRSHHLAVRGSLLGQAKFIFKPRVKNYIIRTARSSSSRTFIYRYTIPPISTTFGQICGVSWPYMTISGHLSSERTLWDASKAYIYSNELNPQKSPIWALWPGHHDFFKNLERTHD